MVGSDALEEVIEVITGEGPVERPRDGVWRISKAARRRSMSARSKKSLGVTTLRPTTEK